VAIEAEFLRLTTAFEAMREALQSLGLTVIEDRPSHGEVLLVERLGNLVEDLRGWAEEGLATAMRGREAVTHPPDLHRARHTLGVANECFIRLEYRFLDEAVSYETVDALVRFGRQRGREWLSWSGSVVQALDGCRKPLQVLDEALLHAWQELAERLGTRSVSLQTTNIGQQISTLSPDRRGHVREPQGVAQDEMT
jgi:hypothetical protein